jgi:hypothetical protein
MKNNYLIVALQKIILNNYLIFAALLTVCLQCLLYACWMKYFSYIQTERVKLMQIENFGLMLLDLS